MHHMSIGQRYRDQIVNMCWETLKAGLIAQKAMNVDEKQDSPAISGGFCWHETALTRNVDLERTMNASVAENDALEQFRVWWWRLRVRCKVYCSSSWRQSRGKAILRPAGWRW
jgi:hypothetical protein